MESLLAVSNLLCNTRMELRSLNDLKFKHYIFSCFSNFSVSVFFNFLHISFDMLGIKLKMSKIRF